MAGLLGFIGIFAAFVFVSGVVQILRLIKELVFGPSLATPAASSAPRAAGVKKFPFSLDALRVKLEEMYFEKKLSMDAMGEILQFLKLAPPAPAPAPQVQPAPAVQTPLTADPIQSVRAPAVPPAAAAVASAASAQVQKSGGFVVKDNIKLLLISGASLFVLSMYLFVRNYWDAIPAVGKFAVLFALSAGLYGAARRILSGGKTAKTGETCLCLAVVSVPFNIYSANFFLFNQALSFNTIMALACGGLLAASFHGAGLRALKFLGAVGVLGAAGLTFFGARAFSLGIGVQYLAAAIGLMATALDINFRTYASETKAGARWTLYGAACFLILSCASRQFFWGTPDVVYSLGIFLALGFAFTLETLNFNSSLGYAAGALYLGALSFLLNSLHVPVYQFGLFYVPAGLLASLRGRALENRGDKHLAGPYQHLGMAAMTLSVAAIFPSFDFYIKDGFVSMLGVLILSTAAFAVLGFLYRHPAFSYVFGVIILLAVTTFTVRYDWSLSFGVLVFAAMACALGIAGGVVSSFVEEKMGLPLLILGLATLSVSLAVLGGKWVSPFLTQGVVALNMPVDQLKAGVAVGLLGLLSYGLLARLKKEAALLYPALACGTLVYFFSLDLFHISINLVWASATAVTALALYYLFYGRGWTRAARSFAVWAQICMAGILAGALASRSDQAIWALSICLFALMPGLLWIGSLDLSFSFVAGIYSLYYLFFLERFPSPDAAAWARFAQELVFVNCTVVLLRGLVTYGRPLVNIKPFQWGAVIFSCVSMVLSLSDPLIAWKVFGAYGVLAVVTSLVLYEGKYIYLGTTLLLASYELLLRAHNVELVEWYSVPAALYILVCGYCLRGRSEARDFLYTAGQMVLYLPSFVEAASETWQWHGVFLGLASMGIMIFGVHQRNKNLAFGGCIVLLLNGVIQSRAFFGQVQRWVYLGASGLGLVTLGGLFEFKRDLLVQIKADIAGYFKSWD